MRFTKLLAGGLCAAMMVPVFAMNVFAADKNSVAINATNFPDGAWRNAVASFDKNSDGYLSPSEISAVTSINVFGKDIESLEGIKYFTNLQSLFAGHNNLTNIDVSGMTKLEYIEFNSSTGSYVEKLDISGCTALTHYKGDAGSVIANGCTSIEEIKTYYAEVKGCTSLKTLSAQYYDSIDLDFTSCTSLERLNLSIYNDGKSRGGVKSINVSGLKHLESLTCSLNKITSINTTGCSALYWLECSNNSLTDLDISSCSKLDILTCKDNPLSNITYGSAYPKTDDSSYLESLKTITIAKDSPKPISLVLNYDSQLYNLSNGDLSYIIKDCADVISDEFTMNDIYNNLYTSTDASTKVVITGINAPATTPAPTAKPTPIPTTNEKGVAGFVERLYTVALGRSSDAKGKADWVDKVKTKGFTGAQLAEGFLYSPEFLGKSTSDSQFLDVLYATFFNRPADAAGKNGWLNLMASGTSRQKVIRGFIDSIEFANLCLDYGIASGSKAQPNKTKAASAEIYAFVDRLYAKCLGRAGDANGRNGWASDLANMRRSGSEVAYGFFFSAEFIKKGVSNEEYVTLLYRVFMDREPDAGGFNDWVGKLNAGTSRKAVFDGFTGSQEWIGICASYGILK